jgi:hypothetical protein
MDEYVKQDDARSGKHTTPPQNQNFNYIPPSGRATTGRHQVPTLACSKVKVSGKLALLRSVMLPFLAIKADAE